MITDRQDTENERGLAARRRFGSFRIDRLFALSVVLPTLIAIVYFGFIASDVYVSESRFIVRAPDKPATTGIGVILKGAGFATANDENYAVKSYVSSRDALHRLNKGEAFREAYTRPGISIVNRFDPTGLFSSFEDLYKYYGDRVELVTDNLTSISTLTVRAYDAKSAQRFNEQLLEMSEEMVNKLNARGRKDLIQFAQTEVDAARAEAMRASQAVAAFRNRSGVVDPEKQAQIQLQMVSKLQDQLISTRAMLSQLQRAAPLNPQIPTLRGQIAVLEREIGVETGKVVGTSRSLAGNAASYEQLVVQSEFAQKQLGGALASLDEARNEARRKQAYVERIVSPDLPDDAQEPRRLRGIVATFLLSLVAFGILRILLAGVKEHGSR